MKTVFVTLVYDGMPFLRHHARLFSKLTIPWEWHVVEGLALLRHDTAWSLCHGGRIPDQAAKSTWSTDGTTDFLNRLQRKDPRRIFLHRKPLGEAWDGKIEMERAYLPFLKEECLLWEISSDELWAPWQVENVVKLFREHPEKSGAFFWCNFFVGPAAVVSSRNGYSQSRKVEWLRVYRYRPGDDWQSHEPNVLMGRRTLFHRKVDIGTWRPFSHEETEAVGAVFDHFAYATPEQVKFKEQYYGYRGLEKSWRKLQMDVKRKPPLLLRDYFPWVKDHTTVSTPQAMGLRPLAVLKKTGWRTGWPRKKSLANPVPPKILLDENLLLQPGTKIINNLWAQILEDWSKTGFSRYLQILERNQDSPGFSGIAKIRSSKSKYLDSLLGPLFLERICRKTGVQLFLTGQRLTSLETPVIRVILENIRRRCKIRLSAQTFKGTARSTGRILKRGESPGKVLAEMFSTFAPKRA